ncbi:hypothetical protein C8R43DRAFT_961510 [Mycena crocata]|nr:hypothetical protein C8R43DRAFT_961510 [Mycena crocata]
MANDSKFTPAQDVFTASYIPTYANLNKIGSPRLVKKWREDTVAAIQSSPLFQGHLPTKSQNAVRGADQSTWSARLGKKFTNGLDKHKRNSDKPGFLLFSPLSGYYIFGEEAKAAILAKVQECEELTYEASQQQMWQSLPEDVQDEYDIKAAKTPVGVETNQIDFANAASSALKRLCRSGQVGHLEVKMFWAFRSIGGVEVGFVPGLELSIELLALSETPIDRDVRKDGIGRCEAPNYAAVRWTKPQANQSPGHTESTAFFRCEVAFSLGSKYGEFSEDLERIINSHGADNVADMADGEFLGNWERFSNKTIPHVEMRRLSMEKMGQLLERYLTELWQHAWPGYTTPPWADMCQNPETYYDRSRYNLPVELSDPTLMPIPELCQVVGFFLATSSALSGDPFRFSGTSFDLNTPNHTNKSRDSSPSSTLEPQGIFQKAPSLEEVSKGYEREVSKEFEQEIAPKSKGREKAEKKRKAEHVVQSTSKSRKIQDPCTNPVDSIATRRSSRQPPPKRILAEIGGAGEGKKPSYYIGVFLGNKQVARFLSARNDEETVRVQPGYADLQKGGSIQMIASTPPLISVPVLIVAVAVVAQRAYSSASSSRRSESDITLSITLPSTTNPEVNARSPHTRPSSGPCGLTGLNRVSDDQQLCCTRRRTLMHVNPRRPLSVRLRALAVERSAAAAIPARNATPDVH